MKLRALLLVVGALLMVVLIAGLVVVWRFDPEAYATDAAIAWATEDSRDERQDRGERLRHRHHQGPEACLRHYSGRRALPPGAVTPLVRELAPR